MNQRFDPSENRNVNPAAWPAEQAGPRTDAVDPLANPRRAEDVAAPPRRSTWPILIVVLAGLVLALLVWLPAEFSGDPADNATTPPAASDTTTMPPADSTMTTPPADNTMTTPPADTNATPVTPETQTPATGTDQQAPATGTAPQN